MTLPPALKRVDQKKSCMSGLMAELPLQLTQMSLWVTGRTSYNSGGKTAACGPYKAHKIITSNCESQTRWCSDQQSRHLASIFHPLNRFFGT